MKKVIHKANTRGHANHGWLDSHHSFSFASYHNPERMSFGMLRVLNDDWVEGGAGFGTHPHDNMEIVSIPLSGALEHKDSTGNTEVIYTNDVQIMSAGSGLMHSEFNHSKSEKVNFLQIWVFPKERNITPRYEQKTFEPGERLNKIQTVVSPEKDGEPIWINQDAFFSLGKFDAGKSFTYDIRKEGNGVYVFLLKGDVQVEDERLQKRDAIGITEASEISMQAQSDTEILFIEVPMSSR
ncbi:pirin family protein [Fulvivirga sp. RKSG066]|uniref:pirin family protein n=1 Tax=Fulvivirga aurantia TaxID=2529383 RepID=UPI0012BBA562|nr:pirin family protein [Fulvivirga aurantia]MTI20717.1 pirin family protein [Fulvivirga aurantia]